MPNKANLTSSPTPAQVTNAITLASTSTGVPAPLLTAISQKESSYGQSSHSGALGVPASSNVMQLTPIAIKQITDNLGYPVNALDTNSNVQGSAILVKSLLNQYDGDQQKALAAYNVGPAPVNAAVAKYGSDWLVHVNEFDNSNQDPQQYVIDAQNSMKTGIPPVGSPEISQNSANIAKDIPPIVPDTLPTALPANLVPTPPEPPDVLSYAVVPYRDVVLDPVSNETLAAIEPPSRIAQGLDELPWYRNPDELTGNPKIHTQRGYPVTFGIITDRDTGATLKDSQGNPISIRLNASMKSYNLQSSHIINKTPSRTGIQLTFWGMNADMISGECSTGLFLNRFGVTNFLNMSGVPSAAQQFIAAAFFNNPSEVAHLGPLSIGLQRPGELRIAAQDAFVEFLSLFKNNGVTWYHPGDYSTANSSDQASAINTQNQTANNYQSAFSPKTGLNTYEMKARNNDVYTRGYIVMNFRSSSYLGFFKSLSWQQDADKPFSWNFSFVFQVERTLSLLYFPYPG